MLTFKALTANCGNGTPGEAAAQNIQAAAQNTDITFLFCQEAHFQKTREELQANLPDNLTITPIHRMPTHTKGKTQLHKRTGIMILAIHSHDVTIQKNADDQVRIRRGARISGSAYNKGGVFSHLIVQKKDEQFTLDLTSAHLDSANEETRALDWANIHQAQRVQASSYEELCRKLPDTVISGFDANTRNQLQDDEASTNCWQEGRRIPAMQSLVMAPLGNHRESRESTYKTHVENVLNVADKKRPNYAKGGMLDLVCYNHPDTAREQATSQTVTIEEASFFESVVEGQSRDHAIIGSEAVVLDKASDFDKVRHSIGCALAFAAPELAAHILSDEFTETEGNQRYLFEIHQLYLSPEGLLQKKLYEHTEKLGFLNSEVKGHTAQHNVSAIQMHLFPDQPWFSFPAHHIPLQYEDLAAHKQFLTQLSKLDDLEQFCLGNPFSLQEKKLMVVVLYQARNALQQAISEKQQASIIQHTDKLIKAIQILCDYKEHLEQENKIDELDEEENATDGWHAKKSKVVNRMITILLTPQAPATTLHQLCNEVTTAQAMLATHRKNDPFNRMLRWLKSLLSPSLAETHGAFFARGMSSTLQQEEAKLSPLNEPADPESPEPGPS
ncbi:hypothetical protein DIZ81_13720 [Legionella taurinensis]|uniref:Uncharacterized protein n=1 Tax=Legionella taurinensis TaxID=70611 RepID=A0AB38N0J0_9GAMM|nr:hypothetical protein [Legionella taurinensis]MDX1838822.1 hypothetical protein [Legionella taurinensis]PUT38589.1 hypothetical protein DB744_13730 [Legionella taurinensis]PUT39498.1 hypothetical protein DB746_13740 [Legionella taurinensis]PUT41630.1 hypothetical protein DB743_13690 [Legionella taurinensis]PUT45001.1 hypothetical protein DB745_13680 [Legionella taurinensis]